MDNGSTRSVDFTPEMGTYKDLHPFRYWCQKVLPLVYDDTLSYYELLCKVVDYLNITMVDVSTLNSDVINLHEAFKQLQEYVNQYFSNLNVQNEINKKLDEMAVNGTLADLMGRFMVRIYKTFDEVPKTLPIGITFKVLGRHTLNDGGSGTWYVTNNTTDKYNEVYNGNYYVLVQEPLNIVSAGCVDTNGNINVDKMNSLRANSGLYIPSGRYYADKTISVKCSIYGPPISLPTISHTTGDVDNYRTASNAVIETTANVGIEVTDSCCLENIVVVGHSYKQTENRDLMKNGNNQPIYGVQSTGSQTGIYLHDYGSRCTGCAVYYCDSGIKCDYYAKVNDCFVFQCNRGIYVLANDNNVINTRVYDCQTAVYVTGVLNKFVNIRCDGISGIGFHVASNACDIVDYCCDFSYKCALYINGSSNYVNGIRMRCCAQYPNISTALSSENYLGNCGIVINGNSNMVTGIPSSRPDISDDNSSIKTMNKIVGLVGGSVTNKLVFIPVARSTTPWGDLAKTISGNAPATIIECVHRYFSSSFTQLDDANVLITNNYANTKQDNPPKGTTHFDGANWWIYTGTAWTQM